MTKLSDRLEALAEKATKGPWFTDKTTHIYAPDELCADDEPWVVADFAVGCGYPVSQDDNNAEFVVELVNNLPTILQALKDKDL